ncbi:hypothetical protein HYFRA_00008658 [Hymenoscyphus fraxineus]|uniref:Uncharacterized protein n=1 Tax=Hymenoscyphus fraxineus TaxID=746836 RepID=A0A9N9KWX2_9HELO|nr:hypothetical protein HYFRA_00008658 [Hymenoscyphus fraxineus]
MRLDSLDIDEKRGSMKHNQDLVKRNAEETVSVLTEDQEFYSFTEDPAKYVYYLTWRRITEESWKISTSLKRKTNSCVLEIQNSTIGVQRRFIETSQEYFETVIDQANPESITRNKNIKTFLENHRASSGAKVASHLIE